MKEASRKSKQTTLKNTRNVTSLQVSESGPTLCDPQAGQIHVQSGPDPVRVSHSPQRANEAGFADDRHLWPDWFRLIKESNPDTVFGEQVASKDGLAWFDTVSTDLEESGYAVGASDSCAAGFGAPHIRQRLYFVGHSINKRLQGYGRSIEEPVSERRQGEKRYSAAPSGIGELADPQHAEWWAEYEENENTYRRNGSGRSSNVVLMANTNGRQQSNGDLQRSRQHRQRTQDGQVSSVVNAACEQVGISGCSREPRTANSALDNASGSRRQETGEYGGRSPLLASRFEQPSGISFWSECDWIPCTDGKARPVEPGTFPLVTGATNRLGRLRGYGNALNAEVAKGFIESYLEVEKDLKDQND